MGEFFLPYDAVRTSEDPEKMLMQFSLGDVSLCDLCVAGAIGAVNAWMNATPEPTAETWPVEPTSTIDGLLVVKDVPADAEDTSPVVPSSNWAVATAETVWPALVSTPVPRSSESVSTNRGGGNRSNSPKTVVPFVTPGRYMEGAERISTPTPSSEKTGRSSVPGGDGTFEFLLDGSGGYQVTVQSGADLGQQNVASQCQHARFGVGTERR